MKNTVKKRVRLIEVFVLILVIAVTAVLSSVAQASDKTVDVNKLMFETVLNNREWIVESLVNDDFSGNPYTELCTGASEESFLNDVLTNYESDPAFKTLVTAMQEYENLDDYATTWTEETAAALAYSLGIINDDELLDYVDNTVKTAASIKYEDIINAVLCEDYTSSWGSTLYEDNSSVEEYRQMGKILKNLSGYQKSLKSNASLLEEGTFESAEDFTDYTDDFLTAYEDSLYNALVNNLGCAKIGDSEALTKKVIGATALAYVLTAENYDPTTGEDSYLSELYNDCFANGTKEILSGVGEGLKIGKAATEYAMLLETLVAQKDSTVQVMNRINANTSDEDLTKALNSYAVLVNDSGNEIAYSYDSIIDYVNKQGYVGKTVLKGAKSTFTNYLNLRCGYFDADQMVMTNAISEKLISLGKCVKLAVWIADKATNIKETSEKIYICTYIQKAIDAAVKTYKSDYNAYLLSKTDDNAKKCLDDLEFIKKLRLFGEKQAYGSVTSQTDSVVGLLLGGGELSDDIEQHYQGNVDALLGCTLSPSGDIDFSVDSGDTLLITPYKLSSGEVINYAVLTKSNGKVIEIPEADHALSSSLVLNGGTVNIKSNAYGDCYFVIPDIVVKGSSTINITSATVAVGGITNKSSLTINTNENASLNVQDAVTGSGSLTLNGNSCKISFSSVECSSFTASEDANVTVTGDMTVSSWLTFNKAKVTIDGDCSVGNLNMQNEEDYFLVNGNFKYTYGNGGNGYLTAGTAEFKGNFTQTYTGSYYSSYSYAYNANQKHQTIFSGDTEQIVKFGLPNDSISNLKITNPKVKFADYTDDSARISITLGADSAATQIVASTLTTNGYDLNVSGDIKATNITLSSGSDITAKNLTVTNGLALTNNKITANGDLSVKYIRMTDEASLLDVTGNISITGGDGTTSYLTNGTLRFAGDFTTSSSPYSFNTSGNHTIIADGNSKQTVKFGAPSSYERFATFVIENKCDDGVVFASKISVTKLFNHNQNNFTLYNNGTGSSFPDYDGDGMKDNVDLYPLEAAMSVETFTVTDIEKQVYTGSALEPTVTVMNGEIELVKDKDYKVTYANNTDIGTATVTITGIDHYTGTKTVDFEIYCKHNFGDYVSDNNATCTQNGTKTAVCTVCGAKDTVEEKGTMLEHSFTETGRTEATISVEGSIEYKCSSCDKTKTQTIPKAILGGSTVKTNGETTTVTLTDGRTITAPSDSKSVTINDNNEIAVILPDNSTVTVSESAVVDTADDGNVSVTITDGDTTTTVIAPSGSGVTKSENGYTVEFTSADGKITSKEIAAGEDVTIDKSGTSTCTKNHTYGDGVVTVVATCTNTGVKTFTCTKCGYVRSEVIPAVSHSYNDGKITKSATCTQTGVKTYTCTKCGATKTETIAKTAHSYKTQKATISKNGKVYCGNCGAVKSVIYYPKAIKLSVTSYTYNGKTKKPSVTVKDSNGNTIGSEYYTVSYAKGRKNVGKYAVTVKFKGNYSGSKTLYFTIKPKNTSITKLTAGKKKFTVKLKKYTTQTTGYQIQYSTSSNFKSAKTVTVKNSTTSKTVKSLKSKKKYYVRVHTYKTVKINGKNAKIYSSWSKAKSVKTN